MHQPYVPEYTAHLRGAPPRSHWPLALLMAVGAEAVIAAIAFIAVILSMLYI